MKRFYITPVTFEENLSVAQIIAVSPTQSETPQIQDTPSAGGEGLVNNHEDWGELW